MATYFNTNSIVFVGTINTTNSYTPPANHFAWVVASVYSVNNYSYDITLGGMTVSNGSASASSARSALLVVPPGVTVTVSSNYGSGATHKIIGLLFKNYN